MNERTMVVVVKFLGGKNKKIAVVCASSLEAIRMAKQSLTPEEQSRVQGFEVEEDFI